MRWFGSALLIAGLLTLSGLGPQAAADEQVCVDDQRACPVVPGDQVSTDDPAATDPSATDLVATDPTATDPTATDLAAMDPAVTEPMATDSAATDQAAADPAHPDTGTVGPPVVVRPFSVTPGPTPTRTATPRTDQLVVAPGAGADKQHLPPGPPSFQRDP